MKHIKQFIELTRLNRPTGYMLLFWPCSWGLTIVKDFNYDLNTYFKYLIFFLLGSILMRSAGCIVNDITDKKFDQKVKRTKKRPIASGKISIILGLIYTFLLCFFAFLVLINFNNLTIIFAIASMPFAFTYPLMKRFTYWPQLFLGFTFNYGLILAWISVHESISLSAIFLYIGAIFWTLGYDTIYGYQDIKDDEIIGVKSTSIKFKKNPKKILNIFYSITFLSLIILGYLMEFNIFYFLFLFIPFFHLFIYQLNKLDIKDTKKCLILFKSNNSLGLIVYLNLLLGKIL